jgi:predicted rRNA methylase YqxC with S4 and FtsJ domains
VLPHLSLPLATKATLVALVKPQYELDTKDLTGGGRVRDPRRARRALDWVLDSLDETGWWVRTWAEVPPGPEQQNREYFVLAHRAE